jgi:hypothetical protein
MLMKCLECWKELAPREPMITALAAHGYCLPCARRKFGPLRKPRWKRERCAHCQRELWLDTKYSRLWRYSPIACNSQCRSIAQRRLERQAAKHELRCPVCHRKYMPRRSDSRYCSSKCKQQAYRQRNKAA